MVKKNFSGQTLAIIILAILLVLAIAFGGVYAFYSERSQQISGEIKMANLEISLEAEKGESGKSEIIIYNKEDIVPGQTLTNSPLVVKNLSKVNIYLIVVYEIKAKKRDDGTKVDDDFKKPVLGLGTEYVNSVYPEYKRDVFTNKVWVDYVFNAKEESKYYRCLVSTASHPTSTTEGIDVIPKDQLALAPEMGSEYMYTEISLTFQAFAIAANDALVSGLTTSQEKCEKIVSEIYKEQGKTFLKTI